MDWSNSRYLGDGIYVMRKDEMSQVWLRTDREEQATHVIAFEYQTLESFIGFLVREYPEEMEQMIQKARARNKEDNT